MKKRRKFTREFKISDPSEMKLKNEVQKIVIEFPRYGLRLKGESTYEEEKYI